MTKHPSLTFRGGWLMAFIPIAVFLSLCVLFFVVFKAFDMTALAMSGIVALLIGAVFARNYGAFWDAVMRGIGSPTSVSIVVILLVIGMFSELVKATNVSGGFVWIGTSIGIGGGGFTLFAFLTVCVVAMATGSSIGTMFTAFPIFYPAGVLLGADPALLAGAIVSGAIFGDNLAPISDTTIISSSTQRFRRKAGVADIAGVVSSRARYALTAAGISAVLFAIFGGNGTPQGGADAILEASANPTALIMLVPITIMLVVAFLTRDIFKAVSVGLVLGTITGLLAGLIVPSDVLGVTDGAPTGFLVGGVASMLGTVALVISVFGIMGVLTAAGVLDRVVDALVRGKLARTPRGAEAAIAIGASATTVLFGGVNSASMMTFGPVADEIGSRMNLHPYRRSNIMDCFAMGISCVVPFLSAFLFIAALLTSGYDGVPALSTTQIFLGALYPLVLTAVMIIAIVTGWGRRFEGPDGSVSRTRDLSEPVAEPAVAEVAH
ncbi:sodium:proton antiporter [Leifsonia sp. Root4]|uniref:Na+/H+ antiporter NhaC family protein n=1 Tax=Leifsonia sp. Root4 TaxID=1736525 RepID=UPI0006F33827|nr:Na+/H+ antiporter NhaC family protein [Leifsonia sp. Root4]KQW06210.1 sodium:proton antiporter [Leifsonia sp. Root4]